MHTLARQARQPSGFLARLVGLAFRANQEGINWTIALLDIRPTDHVLELGFGPGLAIEKAAANASQGFVAGVDFSKAMVHQARKRNAAAIAAGRVELRHADASALPYPDNSFDKVFAANVIYFWQDPLANLKEIQRVMKPAGRLALYLVAKEDMARMKLTQTGVFTLYTGEDVLRLLTQAGFHRAHFKSKAERRRTGVCALAEKESHHSIEDRLPLSSRP